MPKYRITRVDWEDVPGRIRRYTERNAGTVFADSLKKAPEVFCERKKIALSIGNMDCTTGISTGHYFEAEEIER